MAAARNAAPRTDCRLARELDVDLEPALAGVAHLELAEVLEQREHGVVEREQPRVEVVDAVRPRPLGQAPQQLAAEAAALPLVDHRDGRLGGLGLVGQAHVAGDADALAGLRVERAERLVVDVVDLGEVGEVGPGSGRPSRP